MRIASRDLIQSVCVQHIPWHAPEHYYKLYDPDLPVAPHQHLPVDVPDIAVSEIFTTRYMPEGSGRCSCYESSEFDGNRSCCGGYANGAKEGGTAPGQANYTARSYWDSFHDLHKMNKTEFFPHDNTTLAVKDQQAIRQVRNCVRFIVTFLYDNRSFPKTGPRYTFAKLKKTRLPGISCSSIVH